MRAWWMTFMGKPRDHHVYDHAHESPLMYIPLVVLAGGTLFSSYFLFRPMIADASHAATAASMVLPLDGHSHAPAIHHAHQFLIYGVGFAFVIGFAIAIAVYRNGLETARAIAGLPVVKQVKIVLEHKYYFYEVYDLVFVQGTIVVAKICRFLDTWIVDFIFNLVAFGTERFASFSGWVLDAQGIDGIYNGMSKTALDIGNAVRQPQTGRIRNYVLITAGVATVVLLALLIAYGADSEVVAAAAN
jgi:NADH-quinone oxidoreductase subunit L